MLLSDGTVMAENSDDGSLFGPGWYRLTPDGSGHYINGTWSSLAPMNDTRLFFASQLLKDGRLFVAGGEYGSGESTAEVYDPIANIWTGAPSSGHAFSDADSEILPDGRVLVALVEEPLRNTLIYDPVSNSWSNGPECNGIHNESCWVKLPDDSILMVDRLSTNSERYIPSLNQWITDANVPVSLYDSPGEETGPGFLLPNGSVICFGSTGHNAIYTPSGTTINGSWIAGPDFPNGQGCPDAPGVMMPNGKVLVATSPIPISTNEFQSPTSFYEYDYVSNSFARVSAPGGGTNEAGGSFQRNFLMLPDGTVLSSRFTNQLYVYIPDGAPMAAAKPVIQSVTPNPDGSYHLTGTQLNGVSEGAAYGDDDQDASNYPLVKLADGAGNIYFGRTHDWSSTSVMTGTNLMSTEFNPPATLPSGTYSLYAIANGISSDPQSLTLTSRLTQFLPRSALKGSGVLTNGGMVVVSDAPAGDLVVALSSDLTNRLTIPSSITIPSGQASNRFDLTVINNTVHDGDQTAVVAANAAGFTGVAVPVLMIDDNTIPTITSQPTNVTVSVGGSATFALVATSITPFNYYWFRNSGFIPGATNSSYTITNVQLTDSGAQFSCLVSNGFGNPASSPVVLTVLPLPSDYFTEYFDSPVTNLGFKTFTFTPDGSVNYYYACADPATNFPTDPTGGTVLFVENDGHTNITLSGGNTVAIYGIRTNLLYVNSDGTVSMVHYDGVGEPTFYDHFRIPNVAGLLTELETDPGGIVSWKQTADRVAVTYQNVPTLLSSYDTNTFQIELFFDGRIRITYLNVNINSYQVIAGLSAGNGQPANFVPSDFTSYIPCGPVPPFIVTQPQSQHILSGQDATFTVLARGTLPLSYQWLLNGNPISNATNSSYIAGDVPQIATRSQYSCVITNIYGSTNSQSAILTVVDQAPEIAQQPADCTATNGGTAVFSVGVNASFPLTCYWFRDGSLIPGATNSSITLTNVQLPDCGDVFSCLVSNQFGTAVSSNAALTVSVPIVVGYYSDGFPTATYPAVPIQMAGDIPLRIYAISPFNATNVNMLFLDETEFSRPTPALASALPAITSWITNGGKIIIHDDLVGIGTDPLLLGITNAVSVRLTTNSLDVVLPATTLVTSGPFGTVDHSTLGSANAILGFVIAGSLPPGTRPILCVGGNTNELVAFSYPLGRGYVYYCTLQLDLYLEGSGSGAFSTNSTNIYAPNVVAYVNSLGTPISLQGFKLATNGSVQFNVLGAPGSIYRVLASSNLQNWQTIANLTNVAGSVRFTDSASSGYIQRFYRCVMP